MDKVDTYISELQPHQAEIIKKLRAFIASDFPRLQEEFKWNQPVYTLNGSDVAYIQSTQLGANFGLTNAAGLDDPRGLLEGTGKNMKHIKVATADSFDLDYAKRLLTQSLARFEA